MNILKVRIRAENWRHVIYHGNKEIGKIDAGHACIGNHACIGDKEVVHDLVSVNGGYQNNTSENDLRSGMLKAGLFGESTLLNPLTYTAPVITDVTNLRITISPTPGVKPLITMEISYSYDKYGSDGNIFCTFNYETKKFSIRKKFLNQDRVIRDICKRIKEFMEGKHK